VPGVKNLEKNIDTFLFLLSANVSQVNGPLQNISMHIFHLCLSYNILLEVEWILRDKNFEADFLSKMFDYDDWGISQNIFNLFNEIWGPFTCDTIADNPGYNFDNYL
jgi:hypothetical protein